ncbi:MAG: hypothetical protein ACK5PP_08065 [Acidimicrobiales bacterium]
MFIALAALATGAALLATAAAQFVLAAARVALLRRLSGVAVGVVVVGFGTSLPELLVSALAARRGEAAVALGNVVGSDLANLSLLLGVGAVMVPLTVSSTVVRREIPLTVAATVALATVVLGPGVGTVTGAALLAAMVAAGSSVPPSWRWAPPSPNWSPWSSRLAGARPT